MQHITKMCADSLRSFTLKNYDVKLKAAHAHELVAIFLGYKSKNAMLADSVHSLNNLEQTEFILFDPSPQNTGFTDQRLNEFGYTYLDAFQLANCFYSTLRNEESIAPKIYLSFREIAIQVAEQHLHQRLKVLGISPGSMEFHIEGDMYCWENNGDALLESNVKYSSSARESCRYSKYKIYLPRISANLGYANPQVEETTYSGNAAKYSDKELLKKYPIPAVRV